MWDGARPNRYGRDKLAPMRAGTVVLLPILLFDCVGDSTPNDAGGNDATTNDVVATDTSNDVNTSDAGSDADAATANKHLYAASLSGGTLLVFDQPVTSASQPSVVLPANFKGPTDIEIVPGGLQLLVVDGIALKVFIFDLPITAQSVAKTVLTIDFDAVDGTFDNEGNLWLAGNNASNKIEKISPPFVTGTATPSQTITMPSAGLYGINVTNNDTLYVGGNGHIYKVPLPTDAGVYPEGGVDNTQLAFPTGIAFNNSALFVSNFNPGEVANLAQPLQSGTTPTLLATALLGQPARLRFAPNGALGVADAKIGIVLLDAPQFNSSSVTIPAGDAAVHDIRGICFGP